MLRRHFINVSYSEDIQPNQIWYKTSNGEKVEYNILMNVVSQGLGLQQSNLLKKNHFIHDGWWCLTFANNITYTGLNESGSETGPVFQGLFDGFAETETNVLNIIEIKLPNISFIDISSFEGCVGLQSITIPDSVTRIGESAFKGCSSLNSITIPNSVTSIGWMAFSDCFSLTSITIPNSVTNIGESAFSYCSSLTSITFNGTKAQWEKVELGDFWNNSIPATVVHCTDGDVEL